jgi:hypothetical protein
LNNKHLPTATIAGDDAIRLWLTTGVITFLARQSNHVGIMIFGWIGSSISSEGRFENNFEADINSWKIFYEFYFT